MTAYFARSLGLAQLALGLVTVVLTGSVPLTSSADGTDPPSSPLPLPLHFHRGNLTRCPGTNTQTITQQPRRHPPRPSRTPCCSSQRCITRRRPSSAGRGTAQAERGSRSGSPAARSWPPPGSGASCSPAGPPVAAAAPAPISAPAAFRSGMRRRIGGGPGGRGCDERLRGEVWSFSLGYRCFVVLETYVYIHAYAQRLPARSLEVDRTRLYSSVDDIRLRRKKDLSAIFYHL